MARECMTDITHPEMYDVSVMREKEGALMNGNAVSRKMYEQIIKSKGHDFQIGHAYFMGSNNDLISRMNKKVIPLLLEYFMNDEIEVTKILNEALQSENYKIDNWPLEIVAND